MEELNLEYSISILIRMEFLGDPVFCENYSFHVFSIRNVPLVSAVSGREEAQAICYGLLGQQNVEMCRYIGRDPITV